jgi:AhpD family alkylhydroperoxidase
MAEKHFFEILTEETPGIHKAFFDLVAAMEKDGGLDAKTFQLVYIAIKAAAGEKGPVAAHAGMAKKAGATREEVRGAVLVSLMTNGVTGISTCLIAALDAYDKA